MSAFATMLSALHADPNIGTDATFTRAADGTRVAVRISLVRPSDQVPGFGSTGARAGSVTADVLANDLAGIAPRRGDTLLVGATTYRVDDVERDPLVLTYRLTLAA